MDIFEVVAQIKVDAIREEFVHGLLKATEFSDEKIATLAHVAESQVAAIRQELRVK